MTPLSDDTICAISSPPGNGAIALVRMSGPRAFEIVKLLVKLRSGIDFSKRGLYYGSFSEPGQEATDEIVLSLFPAPRSYTGEDIAEIACHGSAFIQQEIIRILLQYGARLAKPGEFTMRAYFNKKMDLAQAEAVNDVIQARTRSAHRMALDQMRGNMSAALKNLRARLVHFLSLVELELDFSEEDVEFANRTELQLLLAEIISETKRMAGSFSLGNAIKNGIPVAIVGKPNVGKSTLLNALLGDERALVSDIAGTTRDAIEDTMVLQGVEYRFIDTAGIRHTSDVIENMGISRTFDNIRKSSLILYVTEATEPLNILEASLKQIDLAPHQRLIVVCNKSDLSILQHLPDKVLDYPLIRIAANSGNNLEQLTEAICRETITSDNLTNGVLVSNLRHFEALENAHKAFVIAQEAMWANLPGDLFAHDIRLGLYHLNDILGEVSADEVLGNIFSRFCIGK